MKYDIIYMYVRDNSPTSPLGLCLFQLAEALRNMCDKWDWRIVGLLYEDNEEESLGRSDCHHQMSSVYQHFKDNSILAKPKNFKNSSNLYETLDELSNISRGSFF